MPWTTAGAQRLATALHDVDEPLLMPQTVWLWDVDTWQQVRGHLYGWRGGDERVGLVVTRARPDPGGRFVDDVRWVPASLIRRRCE